MEPAHILTSTPRSYNAASGFPVERERWDDYIKKQHGVAPRDERARRIIEQLHSKWDPATITYWRRGILDIILDLEVGFRTNSNISKALIGWPLGVLKVLLQKRADERGLPDSVVESIVIVGKVIRIQNEVQLGQTIPNPIPNLVEMYPTYTPKKLVRSVDEFSLVQFPLSKIHFVMPDGLFMNNPVIESSELFTNIMSQAPSFMQHSFNLTSYIEEMSSWEGGSDQSFYLCGDNCYFARRWHRVSDYSTSARIRTAAPMRTAGLRQVILKSYEFDIELVHKLYIPGGNDYNCFIDCLRWCFYKSIEREFFFDRSVNIEVLGQDESILAEAFDSSDAVFQSKKMINAIIKERSGKNSIISYIKRYYQGLPTIEMKKIAEYVREKYGIRIDLWRKNSKNEWENILKMDGEFRKELKENFTFFQMDDNGELLNIFNCKTEAKQNYVQSKVVDGSLGHMLHCVCVYPPPLCFVERGARGKVEFVKKIEDVYKPLLEKLYQQNRYHGDITYEEIVELVRYQNDRYDRDETRTLIFNPSVSNMSSSSISKEDGSKKRKRSEIESQDRELPRNYVYAYDLETVDNTSDIQDMVYPPFRKVLPTEELRNVYDPIECQIPFSAQWVGVNVSDTGKFLERKLAEKRVAPTVYPSPIDVHYTDEDDLQYFLTDPVTDYGNEYDLNMYHLGSCIESFLVDIAVDTKAKGGDMAYLYATNGSKFDAYVVLQYQRFEIKDILKTGRGILFVKLRVPLVKPGPGPYDYRNDDSPKISVILRDLSLIVPGSLSRLCKGFDVPKRFCKQDFPIQMVNAKNCYHEDVRRVCKEYGECDVLALGVILKKVNTLIGNLMWNPANAASDRPPIVQFLTCMSMIRKSTQLHFNANIPRNLQPKAIDIPGLRNWLIQSAIGGRVTPYAKTYMSPFTEMIIRKYNEGDREGLSNIHKLLLESKECMQCLDFTSLYPFTMDSCPMPMGKCRAITVGEADDHINCMHCDECDKVRTLCVKHRHYFLTNDSNLRPFSIIIVKNVSFPSSRVRFQNLCPRKVYNTNTLKCMGLNYSLESNAEFFRRNDGKLKMMETQAYSNVDLYWMRRQGFTFEIVGGYSWTSSSIYNTFIGPAFQLRIDAKKQGNKLLSDFMKLNYNGAYGITIQQDIDDGYFLINLPEELRQCDPIHDPRVIDSILKDSGSKSKNGDGLLSSEELTGEGVCFVNGQSCLQKRKKSHLVEFFADQSPMQIGAAILSYARHIGNLVLFNINPLDYTYTDTDSIAISQKVIDSDEYIKRLIINQDDAPMGSLKNDHADNNGTEPRIFFSLIGAKKVKCHFTLNAEGEVRVFNTFKGLNVSLDLDGKKINPLYSDYISTKTLLAINEHFTSDPVEVQSWKRDLQNGVSIGNHFQHLDKETYMSDFQAIINTSRPCGDIEYFVPHGAPARTAIHSMNMESIIKCTEQPLLKVFDVIQDKATKTWCLDESLASRTPLWKSWESSLHEFIEKYYDGCRNEYHGGTQEYQDILDLFHKIEKEEE